MWCGVLAGFLAALEHDPSEPSSMLPKTTAWRPGQDCTASRGFLLAVHSCMMPHFLLCAAVIGGVILFKAFRDDDSVKGELRE